MRILVNDIAASKTGALAILLDFYEYVKEYGCAHEWIFLTGIDCINNPPANITVKVMEHVKKSQKDRLIFDLFTGSSFIESLEPDVIFSLQNTLTVGKIKRRTDLLLEDRVVAKSGDKVPQVLYVHQPLGFQRTKRFSFFNREEREYAVYQYLIGAMIDASVKRSDICIVQTKWMKKAVAEKTGKAASEIYSVLPDVGNLLEYRPDNIMDTFNQRHFFFPSGEILYKNHECVIKAAQILNGRGYTDFKVHFTLKALSDVTKRTYEDPYENIVYTGRVSRSEVLSEYCSGTLLFPSYIETFGVPMAEARQLGTLIIASDCAFSQEVLSGYENAVFFNPFDANELADKMEQVLKGELLPRQTAAEAADETECSYAKILKLIENVIKRRNKTNQ